MDEEHTINNPYCSDPACWCHSDVDYHEVVTHPEPTQDEIEEVYRFLELQVA